MTSGAVDAQAHVWERDRPSRPWAGQGHGAPEVTAEETLARMDRCGVGGALLVAPWSVYRFDPSHSLEVARRYPRRFRVVVPVDPGAAEVGELIAGYGADPLIVGVRLVVMDDADARFVRGGGADAALAAAERAGLPVCVSALGRAAIVATLCDRFRALPLVVDHLGLVQPQAPPVPDEPFAGLGELLRLAEHPNAYVKVTGVPTLSRRPFPFADIWPPLHAVLGAFGVERCMWGTDWTRTTALVGYDEGVRCFSETDELSASERARLMGETARDLFALDGESARF